MAHAAERSEAEPSAIGAAHIRRAHGERTEEEMSRVFTPADLSQIRYLSWPALSKDGSRAAWVEKLGKPEDGSFPPRVRVMDIQSGALLYETPEGQREQQPCFLADGRLCTLNDASGEAQIWIRDPELGSPRQITTARHGILHYSVDPTGTEAVFETTVYPEEAERKLVFREMTGAERLSWQEELAYTPWVATDLIDKMDEWFGMRKGEKSQLGMCSLESGAARLIDLKGMEAMMPAFSPDGERICFYGLPYSGAKGYTKELFCCDRTGSSVFQATRCEILTASHAPCFTPEGGAVICQGMKSWEDGGVALLPYRCPLDGTDPVPALEPDGEGQICEGAGQMVLGRAENGEIPGIFQIRGGRLWFMGGFHGRNNLYSVALEKPGEIRLEHPGETDIQAFCLNDRGDMALLQGNTRRPAELYVNGKQLTHANAWLAEYPQGKLEEKWIPSLDGKVKLHYWLLHPVNEEPGRRYPAVLDVHGGPLAVYGAAWWHEFHALSAAGFAVIYGDPRGSFGYGHAFTAEGVCWKQEAMDDLMAMCGDAAANGPVDSKRIGITGGSYGGYMTVKMIGSNDFFAAAVAQRALTNLATSYGTGDMGFVSAAGPVPEDFSMLKYLTDRARNSNITRVDKIRVPTLLLHAEDDYRCTFEQAEQLFIALHQRHPEVPVKLVRFPRSNHGMTRTGKMHHQIRHLQEMVDWFSAWLKAPEQREGTEETGGEAENRGKAAGSL